MKILAIPAVNCFNDMETVLGIVSKMWALPFSRVSRQYYGDGNKRGSWWGVPNPSSQLIFSPDPISQLS